MGQSSKDCENEDESSNTRAIRRHVIDTHWEFHATNFWQASSAPDGSLYFEPPPIISIGRQ